MMYSKTISDAVGGGASSGDHTRAAAAEIGQERVVSRNGKDVVWHSVGIGHLVG